ncbi:MAG: HesA/MoeB/ThiF family protein [Bacteroidales bacterium]|nr:HesA/MoeB/ThiF family protein [Bacteroidales bacterium]MBN2818975.1 HesA/MoeB/ThiF family protein [Bacteroidales bacterium]
MPNDIISQREKRRYEQQTKLEGIGERGQELIKLSRILVIGAGGKGTSALKNLITAGVGFIGVSDDTLVQEDTLGRQSLYGDNDIGKQKAIVTKQYLQARNQFTEIKVHNIRLTAQNLHKVIENYHLIIDATNNFETHYAISKAAKSANKPVVLSFIKNNKAVVTTLFYNNKKDLKDFMPTEAAIETKPNTETPVVITNSMAGGIMANEALKIVLKKTTFLSDKILVIDPLDYKFEHIDK